MHTPQFLLWSLDFACTVRGLQTGSDPERTERQLRAVRAVSDARREGRIFEGLCIAPPDGFRIDAALALHGGLAAVEAACGGCPANASQAFVAGTLAGCFGIVPIAPDPQAFYAAVDAALERLDLADSDEQIFPGTRPRWYGLWMNSPVRTEWQPLMSALLAALPADEALQHLQAALHTLAAARLALHVRLYPPGWVAGKRWQLAPHCPHCSGVWDNPGARSCAICGHQGHPAPDKKRLARGRRPYFPLTRLLGEQAAVDFLLRYEAFAKPPESTALAEDRPLAGRPSNPPAD